MAGSIPARPFLVFRCCMSRGFFSPSTLAQTAKRPEPLVAKCGLCGLSKTCKTPKMPPVGTGRRVLIVAEAPGKEEDAEGVQLIGRPGHLLRQALAKFGVDLDEDCTKTNAIICHPGGGPPTGDQITWCRPNLTKTIAATNPDVIIPLGTAAVRAVLGPYWSESDIGPMQRWAGWRIPLQAHNAWVCPTYHPSYIIKSEKDGQADPALVLWWERHLRAAFACVGKPYDAVPDYTKDVEVVQDPAKAAAILDKMIARGGPVAFDYETNMLKPDRDEHRIVCCSVSWRGQKTIAFPWHGEAVAAMQRLLRSPLPKIGANIKFEDRWTRRVFGHPVRGWVWDTMIAAHVCDNRRGATGLKFQAFVRLGQAVWNQHVEKWLSPGKPDPAWSAANQMNRIKQADPRDLMLYCGLDSLLEFKVAELQIEEMKLTGVLGAY